MEKKIPMANVAPTPPYLLECYSQITPMVSSIFFTIYYEMCLIRQDITLQEECNLICVDWEAGAVIPKYVRAVANTRLVGKQLSKLLDGLNKHLGLPFNNIHVIGFSLGAHVAGFAGAELKNLSRITGRYEVRF
jgi:hypothetical protein